MEPNAGLHSALAAAVVVAGLLVLRDRLVRHRSWKMLEVGSLVLFGALALASRLPAFSLSIVGVRQWVDAGLLSFILVGLLIGKPFTLQYAVERVSPRAAASPRLHSTNVLLSTAWALVFADNPIDRYTIGDRTPGLLHDRDGGLEVWTSRTDPGAARRPNWLPAPPTSRSW